MFLFAGLSVLRTTLKNPSDGFDGCGRVFLVGIRRALRDVNALFGNIIISPAHPPEITKGGVESTSFFN